MSRTAHESHGLAGAQLELLTAVQDRLIPRHDDMPGAGELGGADVVSGYMGELPELHSDIAAALDSIEAKSKTQEFRGADLPGFGRLEESRKDEILREVEIGMPREFAVLVTQTYNSYYTNPVIQEILGPGALPPQPLGHTMPDFDESALDDVKKRAKTWRNA